MTTANYTYDVNFQCLEGLRQTSMEVTLAYMGKEKCNPYHAVSATRSEYIIHFILSGEGFYSVGGNTWFLKAGQMFLSYPDEPIVYCPDTNNPWTYAWVGFKGMRIDTILKSCGFSKKNLILPAPPAEEFMDCIDALLEHKTLSFSDDLYRESILLKLFAVLANHHNQLVMKEHPEHTEYSDNTYVNLAVEYIGKMYMRGIRVSDIADTIGISRAYLNHVFQKELNISVQKFLIDFRMHKAANLLLNTDTPIKEIADQVGYSDQLVFSKAFKNKFEMSPTSYRDNNKETEVVS